MNNTDKNMLIAALSQKDVYPKALANFMFREIIEDDTANTIFLRKI